MLFWLLNFPLPLYAYILLWAGMFGIIVFFACLYAKECNAKDKVDALLRDTWNALETCQTDLKNALEVGQPELAELNHDYATLGMLVEDLHQNIADIQKELFAHDERVSKLEMRNTTINIGISKLFQVCDDDYTGPDDDENLDDDGYGDVALLPQPLAEWLDFAQEGLDQLS